jgi:hypothetical protein
LFKKRLKLTISKEEVNTIIQNLRNAVAEFQLLSEYLSKEIEAEPVTLQVENNGSTSRRVSGFVGSAGRSRGKVIDALFTSYRGLCLE